MQGAQRIPSYVVLALTALLLPLLAPLTAEASGPGQPTELLEMRERHVEFSPDGNGRKDRARYPFTLRRAATVKVKVLGYSPGESPGERPVVRGPVRLGELDQGKHTWRWDGRRDGGGVVADGYYLIRFVATRRGPAGRQVSRARASAHVDTVIAQGALRISQDTIHPRATAVEDAIVFTYAECCFSGHPAEEADPFTVDLEIRDAAGNVVIERRLPALATDVRQTTWYAQRAGGAALPAGRYLARVTVEDRARNRRILERYVHVDRRQLVEQVTSVGPFAADNVTRYDPPCYANGCGDPQYTPCNPVPSERFEDGLSFRTCDFSEAGSAESFRGFAPTAGLGPQDQFRVVVTGGPTEPGSDDQARIGNTVVGPGDGTTTTEWLDLDLTDHMYVRLGFDPIRWTFYAPEGNDYDAATLGFEYRHFVPAS